ncbi:hypothetical protein GYMLUDRAFT_246115 [Collybiopsis luxurians FD-317 M1]|uniref:Unplaced genomic scaffold GYMLUscaffold_37, whole genome shotgun sequence n=1 Tax=Collybiopsis luxurians FD-317 M1 TaxID=944289 RepID=A0A0D0B4Z7_9AGAR|nr:hypothetical protein GYMLUDRAFT_246115 [Collybiopsis luxurians FD-317 M1]
MAIPPQDIQVAIPGCAALLSLAILFAQIASEPLVRKRRLARPDNAEPAYAATSTSKTRVLLQILRFVGCLALLVLTALPASRVNCVHEEQRVEGLYILLFSYAYVTIIALISLVTISYRWRAVLKRHMSMVLLVTWLAHVYRNVFPLTTFSETPLDICKGWALWTEISILTVAAIVIPAVNPREYIPVDPKHPMPSPNPEQTASLFSLGFFFFLDPVVFEAYRIPHLPYDRLPPLADDDSIRNLRSVHFKHLDPFSGAKSRNYLFNLIRSFASTNILLWCLSVLTTIPGLLEPIAINGLLKYLEQGKEGTTMRPWFWVLIFFLTPLLETLIVEWYFRVSLQFLVRMEALLTQLVFEHALRIRVKADSSSDSKEKRSSNLIGRINNLVTTDLAVINGARHCIFLISDLPAMIVFYAVFLYTILGWSAFVGIGLTILMAPIPTYISGIVRGYHAERMKKTDARTELLDIYDSPSSSRAQAQDLNLDVGRETHLGLAPDEIGFRNASFTWSVDNGSDGTATPSERRFILKIDDKISFKWGCINLVTGPTGSGKTSMLLALLGEMHFIPLGPNSYFHLPRECGVAYAAQESWVLNETIKDNILFASEYDETRYKEVIHVCGLEGDLELFEAGDETEVGEKGLTLSGGQKARVTLARAIYSRAEILLLDDVLAALDVHTSKWIVEKCLAGDLVKDRTIILVTHNVKLAEPIASSVTVVKGGRISEYRSCIPILPNKLSEVFSDNTNEENEGHGVQFKGESKPSGKLVVAEEIQQGRINRNAVNLYTSAVGGRHSVFYFSTLLVTILVVVIASNAGTNALFIAGSIRGSRTIHERLANAIFRTTIRWLDKTPMSRILTRFSEDINSSQFLNISITGALLTDTHLSPFPNSLVPVDTTIPEWAKYAFDRTMGLTFKLTAIVILTPLFLIPGAAALAAGYICAQVYLKAQLSVKREMSIAKSPVLGHFGAIVAGLASIRAYGAQAIVTEELLHRIDRYSRSSRIFYNLQRWMAIRMHVISAVFIGSLSWYLVYVKKDTMIDYSIVTFTGIIFDWIIVINMLEGQSVSLERIEAYIQIEQEAKPTGQGKPPAYWPASGELQVENLSAKYSPDGPEVLRNLSFSVKSGERIGVVGRTGSGKSSLVLSLLRCIYTTGEVIYDGIPTSSINLDLLRSSITIIPQVPELIGGTLRQNLDSFGEIDDLTLNNALKAAGLNILQEHLAEDEEKITLDTIISGGGSNLSVGQRQIIALARALVRRSKLLILDEATSAIGAPQMLDADYKTDSIIQTSLRNELTGATVITIAHRLQTILDSDRIMVLEAGNIVEFGTPTDLLKDRNGKLRALVEDSSDKGALLKLVEGDES